MSSEGGEVERARAAGIAAGDVNASTETIFDMIIARQIPADIVHEDELCLACRDINPQVWYGGVRYGIG